MPLDMQSTYNTNTNYMTEQLVFGHDKKLPITHIASWNIFFDNISIITNKKNTQENIWCVEYYWKVNGFCSYVINMPISMKHHTHDNLKLYKHGQTEHPSYAWDHFRKGYQLNHWNLIMNEPGVFYSDVFRTSHILFNYFSNIYVTDTPRVRIYV